MRFPLQITFRNIDASTALEERIRSLVGKLEKFSTQITRCQVTVAAPHHAHHEQGGLFDFQIDISVPGRNIVIGSTHTRNPAHTSAYVALRDTLRSARRHLQDYERIQRRDVKTKKPKIAPETHI